MKIENPGSNPAYFPGDDRRKVERVRKPNPTRRRPDEYVERAPEGGIHETTPAGDRLDISQEGLEAGENPATEEQK